jgi:hypothetical protein
MRCVLALQHVDHAHFDVHRGLRGQLALRSAG